jgi:hypothetical protein
MSRIRLPSANRPMATVAETVATTPTETAEISQRTVWKSCDVTCDVTPSSMPLQVAVNTCYQGQLTLAQNRGNTLRACNLIPLVLIPSYFDL